VAGQTWATTPDPIAGGRRSFLEGRNTLARYFDRAWLIYKGAETGLYADLVSTHKRGASSSWRGTVVGAVKWSKFLDEREELELRTLAGMVGRFYVSSHQTPGDRAEVTGIGPAPF
jgi:hypothetical protein